MNSDSPSPGRDYIGVGVGAIVFKSSSEVLLARRGPAARNEIGAWEFPGGAVEFGETLINAVVREFREEYGILIAVDSLLGVFDHFIKDEHQHWISATYLAHHVTGDVHVREPEKCLEARWFPLENLPEPLSIVTKSNLAEYLRNADLAASLGTFPATRIIH
jgi:mutator protein MutT